MSDLFFIVIFEKCPAPAPSPSGQITFCNKSQRATFFSEEHLPVGADQGASAFLRKEGVFA
jgi:hypothetical protein